MSSKTVAVNIRLTHKDKREFEKRCKALNKNPTTFLREVIHAINDGRLRIQPTDEHIKQTEELYQ